MKIRKVEIWNTNCNDKPAWHPVLIRLTTDDGITGVGEVGVAYGIGHSAAAGYVRDMAEQFVIGCDPFNTEKLWADVFRDSFWGQGGGPIVYGAMSAVDMALWDIKGKALGRPVYMLLGGKTNESLRTYASQIQFDWTERGFIPLSRPEQYAEAALRAVEQGYDAVKLDPLQVGEDGGMTITSDSNRILDRKTVELARARIGAVRGAVGDKADIIVELHCGTNVSSGIQLCRVAEEFGCMFVEEPVHCMNPALQRKVAQSVKVPLAAGERIYTRWGYSRYFEDQSVNVIQPDLCLVGGITEGKKVCDYASVYDVTVQAHVCGSPVSTAAALHLETAISNFQIHELHVVGLQDYNRRLCNEDNLPVNGRFHVPETPGLGVTLNDGFLKTQECVTVK